MKIINVQNTLKIGSVLDKIASVGFHRKRLMLQLTITVTILVIILQ